MVFSIYDIQQYTSLHVIFNPTLNVNQLLWFTSISKGIPCYSSNMGCKFSPSNTHKQSLFVFLGASMGRLLGHHACLEQSQMESIIFLLISEKDLRIVHLSISLAIFTHRALCIYFFISNKAWLLLFHLISLRIKPSWDNVLIIDSDTCCFSAVSWTSDAFQALKYWTERLENLIC